MVLAFTTLKKGINYVLFLKGIALIDAFYVICFIKYSFPTKYNN
jgi:hypothetical protein